MGPLNRVVGLILVDTVDDTFLIEAAVVVLSILQKDHVSFT
jgi:hypothetical protein